MGYEMSKATVRRLLDWRFVNRFFVGKGLDVGCGSDPLAKCPGFPHIDYVQGWDQCKGDGDAEFLDTLPDNHFDFVVSSHCLEHVNNPYQAVRNWLRVLKVDGFLIVTIPEWEMYEHKHWPSRYNGDHKTSWTMSKHAAMLAKHVEYVPAFLAHFNDITDIEELGRRTDYYNWMSTAADIDQTGSPAECAIEFVLRRTVKCE